METIQQQALLTSLMEQLKRNQSWCGETHVQKCSYFLQEGLGVPFEFEFVLYKHGPFSFDLRDVLGRMRAMMLIELELQPAPYGPSLRVTPQGAKLEERFPRITGEYAPEIQFVAENLGRSDVAELERLGTALYVSREWPGQSLEAGATRITELKPHIPFDVACASIKRVNELLALAPKAVEFHH